MQTLWIRGGSAALSLALAGCLWKGRAETASEPLVHPIRHSKSDQPLLEKVGLRSEKTLWQRLIHRKGDDEAVTLPLSKDDDVADAIPGENPAAELIDDF